MKTIAYILLAAIVSSVLMALPLHAEEQVQRYIVVLRQRSGAVPDVASLGGKIEFQQDDQLVVTIPPGAIIALEADPKVRYVERVGGTPSDDEAPLIGVPSDPQAGPSSPAARFIPHALGSLAWDSGTYGYDSAGNIVSIGTDNYLYDGAQRLKQSSTKATAETYTYDGFGNMTGKTNNGQTQIIPSVETATNRYIGTGYSYNEAGAVKTDGSYGFSYDALGQPLSKIYNNDNSKLEYYIYTPGDERIGVQRGGWWTWSVRDEGGKVLRQYKSSATNPSAPALWLEDFVWRDGLLLGSQRPVEMGGRRHVHLDHLGTPRLVTSDNGQMVSYHDYYPFGDEHSPVSQEVAGGFDREDPMKFTGHERDYAGGMGGEDGHGIDYMHARYYSTTVGRFLSLDTARSWRVELPQSWNRYSYARGNPIKYIDPDGQDIEIAGAANVAAITSYLTRMAMRPSGRADILKISNDHSFKLRIDSGVLTKPAQVAFDKQTKGKAEITFGQTTPDGHVQLSATTGKGTYVATGAIMTIDPNAVTAWHSDKSGATTIAHEFYHALDIQAGKTETLKNGDSPTSATGPAERRGQAVASERTDMSEADAKKLIQAIIPVKE